MAFIPEEIIGQVLDRSDIVSLISSYIPLRPAGRNFKACCPFHNEKTPSFVVNPDKQIFHCFGCGVGGNVITFVMQQERMEFPEAVRFLADKNGIQIPEASPQNNQVNELRQELFRVNELAVQYFHLNLLSDRSPTVEAARQYLKARGLNLEMVKKFQLGFALDKWDGLLDFLRQQGISLKLMERAGLIIAKSGGEGFYDRFRNRVMFPIFDSKSRCVAFGARTLEKDNPAKYINSPETPIYTKGQHLYGFHWSKDGIGRADSIIVVEGYMDFIMPFEAGIENIVASLGTALTIEQIRLMRRYTTNVVMLFDADQAGEAAMLRSFDALIEEGMQVKVASWADREDPDAFIRHYGVEKFREHVINAESLFDFKLKSLVAKHGLKSIESRAAISTQMLSTIAKFSNAVVQSEYIKRLSQALSLEETALYTELKKADGGPPTSKPRGEVSAALKAESEFHLRPVERDLLKLMLEEKDFIGMTRQSVELADFQNTHVRNIVEKIYELFEQGHDASPSALMSCFNDQKVLRLVSSLMTSEDLIVGDKKRIHRDCVQRLKGDRLRFQRREILTQMENARDTGDTQKLDELTRQFNQLIKG